MAKSHEKNKLCIVKCIYHHFKNKSKFERVLLFSNDAAGPSFGGGVREGRTPPPPPVTTKLKIYPSNIFQNPPYCTNLQLKIKKIPWGMLPDPLTCVSHSLYAKYHYSRGILQGVQLTYFENTPAIQNSTPPPSQISGHGPDARYLTLGTFNVLLIQTVIRFILIRQHCLHIIKLKSLKLHNCFAYFIQNK